MDITHRQIAPSAMKVVRTTRRDPDFKAGRRVEIRYRDLGVEAATAGDLRAEVMHIGAGGISRPTGWHYHTADMQFLFVVKGWVRMEFPEVGVVVLEEGDSITIPGGTVHQELAAAEGMELLEITLPAKLTTVNVPAPDWGQEKAETYGEVSPPQQ